MKSVIAVFISIESPFYPSGCNQTTYVIMRHIYNFLHLYRKTDSDLSDNVVSDRYWFPCRESIYPCNMIVALTLSTSPFSRRFILGTPLSMIARCASTDVNLSSHHASVTCGKRLFNSRANFSIAGSVCEAVPSICKGLPNTIISTSFCPRYFSK